jgi:pyrroline-5-carboxylate reductase
MIGIIGGGMMGSAIISGILDSKIYSPSDIFVYDVVEERKNDLYKRYNIKIAKDNVELIEKCKIIILAVKPQNIEDVLKEISTSIRENHIVVSIAAGVPLSYLERYLQRARSVIRVMPNLPLIVRKGAIGIASNKYTCEDMLKVKEIFSCLGEVYEIPEKSFNILTALTGSGPAFVALILQGFTLGGVKKGLSYETSKNLTLQLFLGVISLIKEKNLSFEDLIKMTSSPGGTTIMGLQELYLNGIIGEIMESISKAEERAKEIELSFRKEE